MAWFGFGKKKEAGENAPKQGGNATAHAAQAEQEAAVKVLGSGCAKCNQLEAAVREALTQLGMPVEIAHITDFAQIAAYGVMTTPALVVDGVVVSSGRVLNAEEVAALLEKAR